MIAIIQNDPEVPPGTLIDALGRGGCRYGVIHMQAQERLPALGDLSGAIVLGGVMSVSDTDVHPFLVGLKAWIQEILSVGLPFLGICLGGQLLASVAGGTVYFRVNQEYGVTEVTLTREGLSDPLFRGVPSPFTTFQWHTDCFVPPPEGIHLARTDQCPYQAFRWGTAAYGLQFHPEVDRETVLSWSEHAPARSQILAAYDAAEATLQLTSARLFANFLDLVRSTAS